MKRTASFDAMKGPSGKESRSRFRSRADDMARTW
jgi:hypothetical protein